MVRAFRRGLGGAALELAALALRKPAPDTESLIVTERVLKALVLDFAARADALCLASGAALLGEERLGIGLRAQGALLPLRSVTEQVSHGDTAFHQCCLLHM